MEPAKEAPPAALKAESAQPTSPTTLEDIQKKLKEAEDRRLVRMLVLLFLRNFLVACYPYCYILFVRHLPLRASRRTSWSASTANRRKSWRRYARPNRRRSANARSTRRRCSASSRAAPSGASSTSPTWSRSSRKTCATFLSSPLLDALCPAVC